MKIRQAVREDLEEMLEIYNDEVVNGVATFDLHPKTIEEREIWFASHNIDNHPLLVAEIDGHVAGYASLSAYREKEAYQATVELSIYIAKKDRQKGVASALMETIIEMARHDPRTHTIVSVITSGNQASVKLHQKFGFEFCGTVKEVGYKFGQYRDIDHYRLSFSH